MASISQNLPRTFYKLAEKWDKKVGTRNFESKCWTSSSDDNREPIHKVAYIMSEKFLRESTSLCHGLSKLSVECQLTANEQIWIYNMRQSDALPKSHTDTQRLYKFVEVLLRSWFVGQEQDYLFQNVHIATSFFVWYFTKPNFFYKDQVMRQTTRKGIQRIWTPLLLEKKEKQQKESVILTTPKSQCAITTDALLPKQQQQQSKLQKDIEALLDSTTLTNSSLDWGDSRRVHLKVSECVANSNSGLSTKQNKKLQKIYNEYTTITTKINKSMDKIRKVERANAKIVSPQVAAEEPMWGDLGPPPPMTVLRRHNAEHEDKVEVEDTDGHCWGCESGQANQQAHMGGCLPDEIEGDDDVPDSWEDL